MKEKLMMWLADILVGALKLFAGWVHDWVFDPDRHARIRFHNRERWWKYQQKALATKDHRDDMRAKAWQIQYAFETPPDEAMARGDLHGNPP